MTTLFVEELRSKPLENMDRLYVECYFTWSDYLFGQHIWFPHSPAGISEEPLDSKGAIKGRINTNLPM